MFGKYDWQLYNDDITHLSFFIVFHYHIFNINSLKILVEETKTMQKQLILNWLNKN